MAMGTFSKLDQRCSADVTNSNKDGSILLHPDQPVHIVLLRPNDGTDKP